MSATITDRVTELIRGGAELDEALRVVNELLDDVKSLADDLDHSMDPISFEAYGRMTTIYYGARIDVDQLTSWLDEFEVSLRGVACDLPRHEAVAS